MRIMGISLGHDSNACLLEDGKIIRYAAEERFNRIKCGVNGALSSFKFCLGDHKIEDVEKFVISSIDKSRDVLDHYQAIFRTKTTRGTPLHLMRNSYQINDIKPIGHHDCHAGSAYYTSGFDKSLIITIDGIGDSITQYVGEGNGKEIRALAYVKKDGIYQRGLDGVFRVKRFKVEKGRSIGWFYGMVTEGLGWRMVTDEGKTMGLAPYGDPTKVPDLEIRKYMYKLEPEGYYCNNGQVFYHFGGASEFQRLADKYGRENLAAAAQKKLEDKVLAFVGKWLKRTGHKNLCTAGGVFLNVKLNQRIHEMFPDVNYWPFPLASDTGLSIGAAMVEYHKHCEYKPERIKNLYWGDEFSDGEIEALLKRNKLGYKKYDKEYVASRLAENAIVAWFNGRMEGGPRALGGRSILMSPLRAENKDAINATVKFREGFRPFCPSVCAEDADRYFDGGGDFMITSCNVKMVELSPFPDGYRSKISPIPAVTHVDGTARPQRLKHEANPKFYDLLRAFGDKTGHPVLLNTSLNVMGEPIVRTPTEAIRCFFGVGLDLLVIGDFMLEKLNG